MMTKRIFSALLAAALSLSLLAGCGSSASGSTASSAADGPQRYSTVFYDVFDTVTQVIAYCDSEEEFTAQMDALHADLVEYNQLYDIYNDYDGVTNIKTINDNAGIAPVTVDDKILGMLELAQTMYDTTGGKLNIALGSVLNIWHNYREAALADDNDSNNQLPTQEELDAAAQHCDIANLIIDEDAKTVYLADPAMSLDVGSVGKGYAVEQAAQAAEARGLTSALISVGGNLRAIGTKPDGSQWVGGVENPWNSSEVYTNGSSTVAAVKMSDLSLVTSGDYQRYYVVDGVRYHHLIDPATLWPAAYFDGVSVLAPDSGVADCLTTGLFCLPLEASIRIKPLSLRYRSPAPLVGEPLAVRASFPSNLILCKNGSTLYRTSSHLFLLDIQFGRHVDLVRDVLAVLFALTHTLGEQILDLPVHRTEVILSPRGKGIVELRIQAQGDLLFRLCHQYRLPLFTMGCASRLPQSTTSRLETIAALRSSSSSTTLFSLRRSSAISTIPTAPSTIILRASMMALACWRCSMTAAISGA